jgi:hypothetical protein
MTDHTTIKVEPTFRDLLAAQLMAARVSENGTHPDRIAEFAKDAYACADAMIKAR